MVREGGSGCPVGHSVGNFLAVNVRACFDPGNVDGYLSGMKKGPDLEEEIAKNAVRLVWRSGFRFQVVDFVYDGFIVAKDNEVFLH